MYDDDARERTKSIVTVFHIYLKFIM